MNYGSLACCLEYARKNEQKEWLQLYLRNDGKNLAFADGLLIEDRYYYGPIEINLEMLHFPAGTPEYLTDVNDIEWFYTVVERMKESYQKDWDVPPLIVNFDEGKFVVNDGRHRYEMYHQLGIRKAYVLFWVTGEEDNKELQTRLEEMT